MDVKGIRHRYFLYTILYTFTQSLFFAFGALLIYYKTDSVLWVLLFNIAAGVTSVLAKSIGFEVIVNSMRRWGLAPVMSFGLFLKIFSFLIIFFLTSANPNFYIVLLLMAVAGNLGSAIYNTGNTTLALEVIGISKFPGFSAALLNILEILGSIGAIVAGIILNYYGLFNFLFLAGAFMLLISIFPLYGIPSPETPKIDFKSNFKTVPWSMILANFNPDHETQVTGIPLIILISSLSLHLSVEINALIAVFSIIFAYVTGKLIDKKNTNLIYITLIVAIIAWSSYIFIKTPLGFIVPGIIITLAMNILTLYREAHMGSFMEKNKSYLNNTFIIEFSRSCGSLFTTIVMLSLYLIFNTLPKNILAMSWIYLLPLAWYGLRQTKISTFAKILKAKI